MQTVMSQTPKEYLEDFRNYLKNELEKVNDLKQKSVINRQHVVAEQFREIEKKLLSFISSLDSVKITT
jgi:hypothetical protein